jgi:hypothetical protein
MKLVRNASLAASVLAASLSTLPGCGQETDGRWSDAPPDAGTGQPSLYRDVGFSDLPIPDEYELLDAESYSFQGSLSRSGVFHYHGRLEWREALEFFRRQLPQAGWIQVAVERGFDFRDLRFRKGQEQLIVVVRQLRGGSRAELQLDNIGQNDLILKGKLPKAPKKQ